MKTDNQTAAAKQEYQSPQLSELGVLSDVTLNSDHNGTDGGQLSAT